MQAVEEVEVSSVPRTSQGGTSGLSREGIGEDLWLLPQPPVKHGVLAQLAQLMEDKGAGGRAVGGVGRVGDVVGKSSRVVDKRGREEVISYESSLHEITSYDKGRDKIITHGRGRDEITSSDEIATHWRERDSIWPHGLGWPTLVLLACLCALVAWTRRAGRRRWWEGGGEGEREWWCGVMGRCGWGGVGGRVGEPACVRTEDFEVRASHSEQEEESPRAGKARAANRKVAGELTSHSYGARFLMTIIHSTFITTMNGHHVSDDPRTDQSPSRIRS